MEQPEWRRTNRLNFEARDMIYHRVKHLIYFLHFLLSKPTYGFVSHPHDALEIGQLGLYHLLSIIFASTPYVARLHNYRGRST